MQELFFCEYDLSFFKHRHQMLRHLRKCRMQHPPGMEIYRNGNISFFEVWPWGAGGWVARGWGLAREARGIKVAQLDPKGQAG